MEYMELVRGDADLPALRRMSACRGFTFEPGRLRRRLELPTGYVTIVFAFGAAMRLRDVDGRSGVHVLGSVLSGATNTAAVGEHDGGISGIELSLPPTLAYAVLGGGMNDIADAPSDPAELLGSAAAELGDRMAECRTWAARFALVNTLVAKRLAEGVRCCPEVAWAWKRIRTGAHSQIATVLAETGWSRRRMERRFREYIGQSPKAVAQIARLQTAAELLSSPGPLAQVATDAGFHDEPHFSRTVKTMTGRTPGQLRTELSAAPGGRSSDRLPGLLTSVVLGA